VLCRRWFDQHRTSEDDVEEARRSILILLEEMDRQKEELGVAEFREETVAFAFGKLCPGLWPFC
jgi:hypothetical protein